MDDDYDDDHECPKYPLSSTPASLLLVQTELQGTHSESRTIFTVEERVNTYKQIPFV
jgi:hypothetical protein